MCLLIVFKHKYTKWGWHHKPWMSDDSGSLTCLDWSGFIRTTSNVSDQGQAVFLKHCAAFKSPFSVTCAFYSNSEAIKKRESGEESQEWRQWGLSRTWGGGGGHFHTWASFGGNWMENSAESEILQLSYLLLKILFYFTESRWIERSRGRDTCI